MAAQTAMPSVALHIVGDTALALYGLNLSERLRKQFARERVATSPADLSGTTAIAKLVMVRADAVIDPPLIQALVQADGLVLLDETPGNEVPLAVVCKAHEHDKALAILAGSEKPSGMTVARPAQLNATFWKALRKKETPYALAMNADNADAVAWRVFMGTYKGATDVVTKHVWPVPAYYVTRFLSGYGVTPNMVTTIGAAFMVAAFWLFLQGNYGLGILLGWAMTFLDTVDGKLARTTMTSSFWGDIFDHGIDLVHPPLWYLAWSFGLIAWGLALPNSLWWQVMVAIFGGYILQRIFEGISIKWLGLEIHIWRPIDTFFRKITARRNPNLILLSLSWLFGRPDIGLIAVAAWTIICLILHALQLMQGLSARKRNGGKLTSWMAKP